MYWQLVDRGKVNLKDVASEIGIPLTALDVKLSVVFELFTVLVCGAVALWMAIKSRFFFYFNILHLIV